MKNLIITHNEIQLNLFLAVTYGMEAMFDGKYAVIGESKEREYEWRVVETKKMESSAYEKAIFYYHINKGDYQMNDLRIGVTTAYIRDEAGKFMDEFKKFINERTSLQPHPESDRWQLAHMITSKEDFAGGVAHSVYLINAQGDVPLAGYGSDYHNALNHLEIQLNAEDSPLAIVKR